jgi:hypothetical protein
MMLYRLTVHRRQCLVNAHYVRKGSFAWSDRALQKSALLDVRIMQAAARQLRRCHKRAQLELRANHVSTVAGRWSE